MSAAPWTGKTASRSCSMVIVPDAKRGLGLRLMAYRAGMLGGTCVAEPAAGRGTLVACRIPYGR